MIRLTPELTCLSAFLIAAAGIETRELDFNLARRSGVVINHICGQVVAVPTEATGNWQFVQELDRAPDNVNVWEAGAVPDAVDYDSSRIFRQTFSAFVGITVATQGVSTYGNSQLDRDWSHLPMNERPISMTGMRHHVLTVGAAAGAWQSLMTISYVIVELSLQEIGILNASRR